MRFGKTVSIALAITLTVLVTGRGSSSSSSSDSGKPKSGGDLVMARAAEATSLLPSVPTDNASIWVIEEIYSTLTGPSKDGKSVVPGLATSWDQSADKLSWTFKLRSGVKFTNGQPLTSADVKFSIEQNQKEDAPFYFIDSIITSMDTPDANTIIFHTAKPWAPLPADMALYANSIVPNNYGGKSADDFANAPIGSGPFKFDSWKRGSQLKLVKNTDYYQSGKPYLDSVTFTVVPDGNTRATQISSGQAQINEFPPYSSAATLKGQSNVKVKAFKSSEVDYLGMNTTKAPLNDPKIRNAIAQAINRDAILKAVLYGFGTVAGSYLSPALWAHDSSVKIAAYNVDEAKKTLASSSQPNGFSTSITIASGDDNQSAEAQLIQSDLAKINIKVQIKTLDPAALLAAKEASNYDMAFGYYTTDIIDPDEIARFGGTVKGGSNTLYTGWKSDQMNQLADSASTATERSDRQTAYNTMQQLIAQNVPYLSLYYSPALFSYSTKVHDFQIAPTGNYFLENVYLSN